MLLSEVRNQKKKKKNSSTSQSKEYKSTVGSTIKNPTSVWFFEKSWKCQDL